MTDYYKDELLNLVDSWSAEQLKDYILKLEQRIVATHDQIVALKRVLKRKQAKKPLENGPRGGI